MEDLRLKSELVARVAARADENRVSIERNINKFVSAAMQGHLMFTEDETPTLEWYPLPGWQRAPEGLLRALETKTGMAASWNGCASCPVLLAAAAADPCEVLAGTIAQLVALKQGTEATDALKASVAGLVMGAAAALRQLSGPPRRHLGPCDAHKQANARLPRDILGYPPRKPTALVFDRRLPIGGSSDEDCA
jgi:hypothetical protein